MRTRYIISAALLLLASATVAGAQQKAAAPAKTPALEQTYELGFRATTTTGDEYRYQRYQDLKSGLASKIGIGKETAASAFDFSAANVGNNDQRYAFTYNQFGKMKLSASFNGQPLNYAKNSLTPYKYAGNNTWTLDAAARTSVQNKVAGVNGIGTTAATDIASIYRGLATNFPMTAQRDNLNLGLQYRLNQFANVDFKYSMTKKSGNQPWGAAFAFNDAQELPMALDNTVNEFMAGLELVKPEWGMLRAEYRGSFFKNQFASLTWDNPIRATDYDNGKLPPAGPWDASGYSNGNGPAIGRMAMAPDNSLNTFSLQGLYKMPGHSTLNGTIQFSSNTQDAAIIPYTTNTKIANAATYLFFPGLASLQRSTAQGDVKGLNAAINFSTRPTEFFGFDMKYRFNDRKDETPVWHYDYNVRFDAVPENTPGLTNAELSVRENMLEASTTFTIPRKSTSLKLGYIMDEFQRQDHAFGSMTDYTLRAALDAYQNQYFSLRGLWENTARVGTGFNQEFIVEGGAQPNLRFFDDAELSRTKGTVIFGLTPSSKFDVNLTWSATKDSYDGTNHQFGLKSNDVSSTNVTVNMYPTEKVTVGVMYGLDAMKTFQTSRTANPLTAGVVNPYESWFDPLRDWNLSNTEKVKSAGAWIDLIKAMPNTDVRFSYNYSNSDNAFVHGGPRILAMISPDNAALRNPLDTGRPCSATGTTTATTCFIGFPNVTNTWSQAKVDIRHMFKPTMGFGIGYQYEKLDIVDFATTNLADGTPRMDPLGAITTGYGNRPYTGGTAIVKLIYKF